MPTPKKTIIRLEDMNCTDGRIVIVEPPTEAGKDIVDQYIEGSIPQERRDAVELAARISKGLLDAFLPIDVSSIGDAIMRMANALGKPLPDELCVSDITKGFRRPHLNAIYNAVANGRLRLADTCRTRGVIEHAIQT